MKQITKAEVLERMEDGDWSGLHDVVLDAANLTEQPSRTVLEQVFLLLPQYIVVSALEWGFSDTGVRDDAYVYIEEKVKNYGSLQVWLSNSDDAVKN